MMDNVERSDSKYILGIFIDFVGAFDNITWKSIFRKLDQVKARDSKINVRCLVLVMNDLFVSLEDPEVKFVA